MKYRIYLHDVPFDPFRSWSYTNRVVDGIEFTLHSHQYPGDRGNNFIYAKINKVQATFLKLKYPNIIIRYYKDKIT
jgi:hypothetical protein